MHVHYDVRDSPGYLVEFFWNYGVIKSSVSYVEVKSSRLIQSLCKVSGAGYSTTQTNNLQRSVVWSVGTRCCSKKRLNSVCLKH